MAMPRQPDRYLNDEEFRQLVLDKSLLLISRGVKATTYNLQNATQRLRDARCSRFLETLRKKGVVVNTPDLLDRPAQNLRSKPEVQSDDQIRQLILKAWQEQGIYPSTDNKPKIGIECTDTQWQRVRNPKWMHEHGIAVRSTGGRVDVPRPVPEKTKLERPATGTTAWYVYQYRMAWPHLWGLLRNPEISPVDVNAVNV